MIDVNHIKAIFPACITKVDVFICACHVRVCEAAAELDGQVHFHT